MRKGLGETPTSRIDDFFCNDNHIAQAAHTTVLDMTGSSTDHNAVVTSVPFQALSMIPPPTGNLGAAACATTQKLRTPLTQDEAASLRAAIELQHGQAFWDMATTLQNILTADVLPHWAALTSQAPDKPQLLPILQGLTQRHEIQQRMNELGEELTTLLCQVRDTVITHGPTVATNPTGLHMYPRTVKGKVKHLRSLRKQVAQAISRQDTAFVTDPDLLQELAELQDNHPDQDPDMCLKNLKQLLNKRMKAIDKWHLKVCQQGHIRKQQELYDRKQKLGNHIIIGQYKSKNNAALHAVQIATGTITTDPEQIMEVMEEYYTDKMAAPSGIKTGIYDPDLQPRQYPWAAPGADDPFTLCTALTTGAAPRT